jgi:hypothetical protein
MKMVIEIPEVFADGEDSLVCIDIENVLEYCRPNERLRSLSCEFEKGSLEYSLLMAKLDQISETVLKMIDRKLIPIEREEL